MDETKPCPFPNCRGQMLCSSSLYQSPEWFCNSCWFTIKYDFLSFPEPDLSNYLAAQIARHREQIVAKRRKEVSEAVAVLRRYTLADDDPEVAETLQKMRAVLRIAMGEK